MMLRTKIAALCLFAALFAPQISIAQTELSFYGGYQTAPHSVVSSPAGTDTVGWLGKSFAPPPYYGLRATVWNDKGFGWGVDINHAKVYADTPADYGYERLEFTDGLNIVTATVFQRYDRGARFTPYLGAGLGVAVPHVDIRPAGGGAHSFGYQLTGPAVKWVAGASMPIMDGGWKVFAEYSGTYSDHKVDLASGGTLRTSLVTNALNIGVSITF